MLGSAALLTAGVLTVAPSLAPSALPSAAAYDCPQAEVIFARGTSEPPGIGRVGTAFVDALRQQSPLNIDVYAVNYPASRLQLHTTDGANDAINRIKAAKDQCPDTQLVLGGYSQGASVIDIVTGTQVGGISWGSQLPSEYANQVVAVATFGNPADRTGGPISQQSALFGSKAIDLCNPGDPICSSGMQWSSHLGYVPGLTNRAASFAAARV